MLKKTKNPQFSLVLEIGGEVTAGTTGDALSTSSLTSSVSIPFFQDSGTEL